jgi:hypothetical protein
MLLAVEIRQSTPTRPKIRGKSEPEAGRSVFRQMPIGYRSSRIFQAGIWQRSEGGGDVYNLGDLAVDFSLSGIFDLNIRVSTV